jgi:excinuclease ABC subunit C
LLGELERRMKQASSALNFEEAARMRDRIQAVTNSVERQQLIDLEQKDRDVLGCHREGASGLVLLMRIRQGRWLGVQRFPFSRIEMPDADLLRQFLTQHYGSGADLPAEILLPRTERMLAELVVLAQWLKEHGGKRVRITVPLRGKAAGLVRVAQENAAEAYRVSLATASLVSDRLERLKTRLGLSRLPRRIECFDLSTLGGRESVGSMAVLLDGEPKKSAYRRYRIRAAQPDSDTDMMREVVQRRFKRLLEGEDEGPDLVVLDGGLGQLRVIQALFADMGITDVDLVALAKGRQKTDRRERVFLPGRKNPVPLRPDSDELFLLGRIRDEAHRFAISYHRRLRRKTTLRSKLDEIRGVGPVLRKRLLGRFKGLRGLRGASIEELAEIPGVSHKMAERIHHFLSGTQQA